MELQKKSYEEQKVLSGIVQKLLEEINNKPQKEIINLESFNNKLDIIANRISSLTDKKSEEINAINRIATPLENIYDLQQMKEYLDKTAKAFAAINIQSQAELDFNHRKMIILEYFENFKKEKEYLLKNDETLSEQTLLYLLLLFTDKFSYAELHLVLQDLLINRFYAPGEAEVNKAIDENIFLSNQNNYNTLRCLVAKESRPQATITERKSFEQRMQCQLSSFKEVLTIFQTYAFRILLREKIFQNKYDPYQKDEYGIFQTFMKNTTKQIESLINGKENDQALDEKIQNIILKFNLKANSEDERSEIRKTNLNKNNPNSYIKFDNRKDVGLVLSAIGDNNNENAF